MTAPRLFLGQDMAEPLLMPLADGQVCVFTERRPGRDTENEDGVALIPGDANSAVVAVADGLGGLPAGDLAAAVALQQLTDSVAGQSGDAQREAVLTGIEAANAAVLAQAQGGGTTLAVVSIANDTVRAYHAGDSMIMVCGQRGKLKYQSVPHSPVGYAEASGMLDADAAMFHAERHLVSNMVGMTDMRLEIGPLVQLARYDTVVVGSDGLFDNLFVSEIIELVRAGPLVQAAQRLLASARERMQRAGSERPHKPDDLAFILFRRS
ncbi:MAG: protein phosphatase 2C domain-containing protein [Pseudomonadota bacterium]